MKTTAAQHTRLDEMYALSLGPEQKVQTLIRQIHLIGWYKQPNSTHAAPETPKFKNNLSVSTGQRKIPRKRYLVPWGSMLSFVAPGDPGRRRVKKQTPAGEAAGASCISSCTPDLWRSSGTRSVDKALTCTLWLSIKFEAGQCAGMKDAMFILPKG
jgi:hypothetical protein